MTRSSFFQRFTRDERGISAVEFALLAPILIFFYMGMSEFCGAFMAQKRMSHATSMVADLVAQEKAVTPSALSDISDIGGLIMKPFPSTTLHTRVSSVTRTGGVLKVDWSWGHGLAALRKDSTFTLPPGVTDGADLVAENQSLIVSESSYEYVSIAKYIIPKPIKFSRFYFLRPRHTDKVECATCSTS